MSDNMDALFDYSAYDDFVKDAEKDDRVGDHTFLVNSVVHDNWPSGDARYKFGGVLVTANNAKADLTMSPPPPPDVLKAESGGYAPGKKKAIANTITLYKQLGQHYGIPPEKIQEGQEFRVKTTKTRRDEEGKGGFIRVIAFLPRKGEANGSKSTDAPF